MSEYRCPICLSYQNANSEHYTHGNGCPQLKYKDEMPKIKTTKECIAEALAARDKEWVAGGNAMMQEMGMSTTRDANIYDYAIQKKWQQLKQSMGVKE